MKSISLPSARLTSPEGPPRLFAMVSTRKSRLYTPHALESFFDTTMLRECDSLVIINNDDPAFDEIAKPYREHLSVIANQEPRSFASNANMMIARAIESESDLFFLNNDIIFTDNWLAPLVGSPRSILSPISNREVQLAGSAVVVKTQNVLSTVVTDAPMDLERYLETPRMFQALAEANSKLAQGMMKLIVFPFFCVRLPLAVMREVGRFDEGFGRAGGEDYDYCFRAWLAGFDVQMVLPSYLIHFWGKSTWSQGGASNQAENYATDFLEVFRKKWGDALFDFVLRENDSAIRANPDAMALRESGDLGGLIRLLMVKPVDVYIP